MGVVCGLGAVSLIGLRCSHWVFHIVELMQVLWLLRLMQCVGLRLWPSRTCACDLGKSPVIAAGPPTSTQPCVLCHTECHVSR